jgi:hypothetical protein
VSSLTVNSSALGGSLRALLTAQEITPGDAPSYQLCKSIAAYHPLGAKMSDSPISMAQSQLRNISVPKGPSERLVEAFQQEWEAIGADRHIFNVARLSRVYGVASIAMLVEGVPTDRPVDYKALWNAQIAFNVLDPLNTAGSLVLNQNPNAMDFQKVGGIAVQGQNYHRSRTVTMLNENPLYIEYTQSAFGYVGRSVYQRALYPLKSFIQSMVTDDLVTLKSGVLITKLKQPGSIIDGAMAAIAGVKRSMVQEAVTQNVLTIGVDEAIESLNLQNIDGAFGQARKDILENIAVAADMPAKLLNSETFAEGFGEGSEDAKYIAQFIDRIRIWMQPLYDFFDQIVMHRAWNREFYKTIQSDFPDEYKKVGFTQAFYDWRNSFEAGWPNLLEEPDSEKAKVDDVKLKAVVAMVEILSPMLDPENKATLVEWAAENFNALKMLFNAPLNLDIEALKSYTPPEPAQEPGQPKPFASQDSTNLMAALNAHRRRAA